MCVCVYLNIYIFYAMLSDIIIYYLSPKNTLTLKANYLRTIIDLKK